MPHDDQGELFYWVDEFDQELGSITRAEAHDGSKKIHRSIHILIFNSDNQLLLQKRSQHKDVEPGKWCLSVGGHVTYGQSYAEAAVREMREELGIQLELTPISHYLVQGSNEREYTKNYRASTNKTPKNFDSIEIDAVDLYSLSDIKKMIADDMVTPMTINVLKHHDLL